MREALWGVLALLATVHAGALFRLRTSRSVAAGGLAFVALFPFSGQFPQLWSLHLVTVFDYWYLLVILFAVQGRRWMTTSVTLSTVAALSVSILVNLPRELGSGLYTVAADLRFLLYVLAFPTVSAALWNRISGQQSDRTRLASFLFLVVGIKALAFLVLTSVFRVGPFSQDAYSRFVMSEQNRYLDLSLLIGCLLLVSGRATATPWRLLVLCAALVISGSRAYLLATLLALLSSHLRKRPGRIPAALSFAAAALLFLPLMGPRYAVLLHPEQIGGELATRSSPFVALVEGYSPADWILGRGVGTSFQIPWFSFVEGSIRVDNPSVDSSYLTLVAKFGAASVPLLLAFFALFRSVALPGFAGVTVLFVAVVGLVTAPGYQLTFGGTVFVLLMLPFFVEEPNESPARALPVSS